MTSRRLHATRPGALASVFGGVLSACLVLLCSSWFVGTAEAASYRYWTYWTAATGEWTFGTAGPAASVPVDGSVEGWRFAVTGETGQAMPRLDPATARAQLCAGITRANPDDKLVAVVVDSGVAQDAPAGQTPPEQFGTCVSVPADATGADVLRAAKFPLRFNNNGLLCAIAGYPTGECAPVVADVAAPSASDTSASKTPSATASASSPSASPSTPAQVTPSTAEQSGNQTSTPSVASSAPALATAAPIAADGASSGNVWAFAGVGVLVLGLAGIAWRRGRSQ